LEQKSRQRRGDFWRTICQRTKDPKNKRIEQQGWSDRSISTTIISEPKLLKGRGLKKGVTVSGTKDESIVVALRIILETHRILQLRAGKAEKRIGRM